MLQEVTVRSRRWLLTFAAVFSATTIAACLSLGYYLWYEAYRDLASDLERLLQVEAQELLKDPKVELKLIRTGNPDERYNCHGWTFTRGQRSVSEQEVEQRLKRYRKVDLPIPGDIIIYRNRAGEITHSGVVKATGRRGFVLIESKWGSFGRFLHEPTTSRLLTHFTYYRLQRPETPGQMPAREKE